MLPYNPKLRKVDPVPTQVGPDIGKLLGVSHRGSFNCEARSFCTVGDSHVWVSERSGAISVRNARTGDILMCVDAGTRPLFANCMQEIGAYVWAGSTDGRLCIYETERMRLVVELVSPEVEHPAEIFHLETDGRFVYTSTDNCTVDVWDVRSQSFVRCIRHRGPVRGLCLHGACLYTGDGVGAVAMYDAGSGDKLGVSSDSCSSGVCAMVHEQFTNTIWVARENVTIDVYNIKLELLGTVRDSTGGKITSLATVGGKVWGTGASKAVFVWHATSLKLIGTVKDHTSFVFTMGRVFTSETARFWTLGNDKKVNIYDGEGFFQPVRGISSEAQQHYLLQQLNQALRKEKAALEAKLAAEEDKVADRNTELERLRQTIAEQAARIQTLEHAQDCRDESTHNQFMDRNKLMEQVQLLTQQNGDLRGKLNLVEKEKSGLRADIVRLQEECTKLRGEAAENRRAALESEQNMSEEAKQRLRKDVESKQREVDLLREELRQARDAINTAQFEKSRIALENSALKERAKELETLANEAAEKAKAAEAAKARAEETLMLRENELRKIRQDLLNAGQNVGAKQAEYEALRRELEEEREKAKKLQNSLVLKNSEMENLKTDRDSFRQQLDFERGQSHDARNNETKLRLAADELRRQLEVEKNNVKRLQDQYTIFQFVINSRGELVQHIWTLHNKLHEAFRFVQALDVAVRDFDPTQVPSGVNQPDRLAMKREWRGSIADRSKNALGSISDCSKQAEYVVCNYFSDYEKMHLGLSTSQHRPDNTRPPIVGEELLSKLRDVALPKQFVASSGPTVTNVGGSQPLAVKSVNNSILSAHNLSPHDSSQMYNHPNRSGGALPKPLPAPYNPSFGPSHNVSFDGPSAVSSRPTTGGL